eukprot:NODE_106_length_19857_cov_0.799980.p12 type:complete len:137 gc:universal NODE_106_length_19857_cov_0.799980:7122-7532(+)
MHFYLTRTEQISCAHSLYDPSATKEHNFETFQKCTNLHGHNYSIIVTVRGSTLVNGMLMNTNTLKECILKVVGQLDHSNLNDHDYFIDKPSTTECLTLYVFEELQKLIKLLDRDKLELYEVEIKETDKNSVRIRNQ